MTKHCPEGHQSVSTDYCDVCGTPMAAPSATPAWARSEAPAGAAPGPAAASKAAAAPEPRVCPHCGATSSPSYLFCEDCGYDFTTGALPRSLQEDLAAVDTRVPVAASVHSAKPAAARAAAPARPAAPAAAAAPSAAASAGESDPEAAGAGAGPTPSPAAASAPPASGRPAPDAAGGPATANPAPRTQQVSRRTSDAWAVEVWIDPDWFQVQEAAESCPSPGVPDVVLVSGKALIGRHSSSRRIVPDINCGADSGVSRRHAEFSTDGRRWWVEDLGSSNGTFVGPASGPLPEDPIASGQRVEVGIDDRIYVGAWTRLVVRRATASEIAGEG